MKPKRLRLGAVTSDVLSGVQFLLNDQFSIGEKVEIGDKDVIGTIEQITLTQTVLRGEDGELWIVPNGDVRTIRNFSRGSFSPANVHLTVAAARFDDAMEILEQTIADLGNSVVTRPEIISAAGEIGETVTLTLVLKAPYGKAPEVRRAALSRIQDELAARGMISGVEDERIAG
ncbi:MAG: mechanosensitive ion channel [Roseiflexaceae bacterium]|nr:mechanosensitive ion channel [Roseiflexaceae bacterium]